MYSKFVIDFYKDQNLYNEEMFNYLWEHTDMVDYYNEDDALHIGFGVHNNNFFKIAKRLRICLPYPIDSITKIYNIHELAHAIVAYRHLNKRYVEDLTLEALPFLYEKLYIDNYGDEEDKKYGIYLDSLVDSKSKDIYKFALYARDFLLEAYDKDIDHMEKLSKKLVKKYLNEKK